MYQILLYFSDYKSPSKWTCPRSKTERNSRWNWYTPRLVIDKTPHFLPKVSIDCVLRRKTRKTNSFFLFRGYSKLLSHYPRIQVQKGSIWCVFLAEKKYFEELSPFYLTSLAIHILKSRVFSQKKLCQKPNFWFLRNVSISIAFHCKLSNFFLWKKVRIEKVQDY